MKLAATILMRDESDIISQNIEHHINQGFDYFVISDNCSVDGSLDIVSKYPEVIKTFKIKEKNYNQTKWVTDMARWIQKNITVDWICHIDADEFWSGFNTLSQYEEDVMLVKSVDNLDISKAKGTNCREFVPVEGLQEDIFEPKLMPYFQWSHERKMKGCKIIHRPDPSIVITQGNHDAYTEGFSNYQYKQARGNNIFIDHYPIRSYKHFERKVINGGSSYEISHIPEHIGHHWRRWYKIWKQGKLKEEYEKNLLWKQEDIRRGLLENKIMSIHNKLI